MRCGVEGPLFGFSCDLNAGHIGSHATHLRDVDENGEPSGQMIEVTWGVQYHPEAAWN